MVTLSVSQFLIEFTTHMYNVLISTILIDDLSFHITMIIGRNNKEIVNLRGNSLLNSMFLG